MKTPILKLELAAKRLFLLSLMTAGLCQILAAQDAPNILPPSPQSQQFFKHFNFPENNPNGTINYSVPIYEVKSGSLTLPISISYVSGGSKRADLPGEVGYNWSLNAGGRIARTIYGKPDEYKPFQDSIPYMNNGQGSISVDYNYLGEAYYPLSNYDSEFDMYSYSFGNISGKFVYKQFNSSNSYDPKAYTIPEKPYHIDGVLTSATWTIVDDKGITYKYQSEEQCGNSGPNAGWTTARLLNSMISADKKDTVSITYQQMASQVSINGGTITRVNDNNTITELANYILPSPYSIDQYTQSTNTYVVLIPQYIYFKGGKIVFDMNSAHTAIEYIKIYDKNNTLIKQFQLTTSGGNLTELRFKDINGANVEKYAFEYYPHTRNEYQSDFIGYVKADGWHVYRETGVHFIYVVGPPVVFGGGNFTTANTAFSGYGSDGAAIASMLKKVTYPTGGSAEYSYEENRSEYGSWGINSGGMRLSEVKLTDNNGNLHYKTYKYGINNESGKGLYRQIPIDNTYGPDKNFMAYETRVFPDIGGAYTPYNGNYRKRIWTSSILPEVAEAAAEATFYPTVTVYDGTPSNNTGKTVYNYNTGINGSRYQISAYPYADWGPPDVALNIGADSWVFDYSFSSRYHINEFYPWRSFPLESTTVYKNNGSGYDTVKTIINNYNYVETQRFKGLHISRNAESSQDAYAASYGVPIFYYDNYWIMNGREDLVSTVETLYTPVGNVATSNSYEYNNYNQVSKATASESNGGTNITTYTYATDYASNHPYAAMVANNMISQPIEQTIYKNSVSSGNFLQTVKTDYAFWYNGAVTGTPNNSIYPEKVWTKKVSPSNPYVLTLQYNSYDEASGNILQFTKLGGAPTSYVWGYNKLYPIFEVKNASYSNVASTLTGTVLNNLNSFAVTDSYVRSQIATLKSAFPDALITTQTYKPLVGTTSTTDAKGMTTYYEYDDFQRLINVKDKDRNIIKHTDYHYQQ